MAGVRLHQFKIAAGAHFHQFHCTKYKKLIWKQKQKTRTLDQQQQQQQQQQGFPTGLANHILTIISPHPESSAESQSQPGERNSKASTFSSSNQSSSN